MIRSRIGTCTLSRRTLLRGFPAFAALSALSQGAFATQDEIARRFEFLSKNGNSNCSQAFLDSIPSLPDTARLQGSCCGPMDLHRYREQLAGLEMHVAIKEIPPDPYDIEAALAKRLLPAYSIELEPEQQKAYDQAMTLSSERVHAAASAGAGMSMAASASCSSAIAVSTARNSPGSGTYRTAVAAKTMFTDAKFLSRRAFLLASAGAVLTATRTEPVQAGGTKEYRIIAKPARKALLGQGRPATDVWTYDGEIPGPTLRLRQREPVRILVRNDLDQETTVHWHGIRLPNAMDGVPGLTQVPIKPGEIFAYEFTPPDAGTFWYHPHANSLEQLGRGLAGALIVEEPEPTGFDRDIAWTLMDWRLTEEGQLAPGFGNAMEAAMSGRIGNIVTLNGAVPSDQTVRAGERLRLRLINTSLARIMALRIEEHRPIIIAIDGQPCAPHEPEGGRLVLGPAMRIDLMLDMQGKPGRRYAVIDDYYDGLAYELTSLVYEKGPPVRSSADAPFALTPNPLPEPALASAERHELTLQGGMMGGGAMSGMGGMMSGMSHGAAWAINGTSMTGDGHAGMAPLVTLKRGGSHILVLRNETAWWHPMHFHGHSFKLLSRSGKPVPYNQWSDTVLLAPKDVVECAFVADNPGDWMLHCHVTDHQMTGLMTVLRVA